MTQDLEKLRDKQVLVTGGTGFLGGALVCHLLAHGIKTRVLVRHPQQAARFMAFGAESVYGDLSNSTTIDFAVAGCDVIFHCAALMSGPLRKQRAVNFLGTLNVVQAAKKWDVKRLVHVSTVAVYGYGVSGDVCEKAPYAPGDDAYHHTKIAAEKLVHESGIPYSIVRPGMIYGPSSGFWTAKAFKVAHRNVITFPGSGQGTAYPIYVDDVVSLLCRVAVHPAAVGEAFNCTPDPSPTIRDYLLGYAALANKQPEWRVLPVDLLLPAARIVCAFGPMHNSRRDLADILEMMQRTVTYRMDKARDLLGWQPAVSLEEGQRRCVPYLQAEGLL